MKTLLDKNEIKIEIEKFKKLLMANTLQDINYIKGKYPDLSYFYREHGINLTHKQIVKIIKEKYGVELVQKRIDGYLHYIFVDKNSVKRKLKTKDHFEKWLIEHKDEYTLEMLNSLKLGYYFDVHFGKFDDRFRDLDDIVFIKVIKKVFNLKIARKTINGTRYSMFVENEEK